jgi:hypothetical protein
VTQEVKYFPLGGGLDVVTPGLMAKPGTARASLNYESDQTGYRRMFGFERYDGQQSPTDAYDLAETVEEGVVARDAARAAIAEVPGSGPVRGVHYYDGDLYAWRDSEDGSAGVMWMATPSGWTSISSGFPPEGYYEVGNFNFYGSSNRVRMYGINGVGQGFEYDGITVTFIATGMDPDIPIKLTAHKRHLFFAFAGGSVQHSSIGDPLDWNPITGAAEIAVGDEITDLIPAAPANMVIMARNSVQILYGNDATDWQLEALTSEAGALPYTAEKMGPVIYMDNRGVRSLDTTPSFGNFTLGTMTQLIAPLIRTRLASGDLPVAACRVRARDLYRLFFKGGEGISVYMGKKMPETMPIYLGGIDLTCITSVETVDGSEKIWFGADNGFVYQMDKGRSYDGQPVQYYLRLPFNHMGGPNLTKRWHKVALEYDAASSISLSLSGEVDNAEAEEPVLAEQILLGEGGGGFWDAVNWDQFYWSAPVDGEATAYIDALGKNLSLLFGGEEADEEPHILQGLTLYYTVRGALR